MVFQFNKILLSFCKLVPRYIKDNKSIMWELNTFEEVENNYKKDTLVCKHDSKYSNYNLPHPLWSLLGLGLYVGKKANEDWQKEKEVANHIALAENAIKDGNLRKAEEFLENALTVSDSTQIVGIMCVYDMLATIAYRQGEVSKAEEILVQVIEKLLEMGMKPDHNTVVNFSLKLSRIYSNLGQDTLAEMGFRNCLAIQKKKYLTGHKDEETTMLWINTLFWYGKFLAKRERYQEARQCFESAYTMCAHVKTIETNQVMVMLYNLGETAFAEGDVNSALRHMLNAVILGKSTNSPDLPVYYTKIGIIYLHKGVFTEAKNWCEDGKQVGRRFRNKVAEAEANDCLNEVQKLIKLKQ